MLLCGTWDLGQNWVLPCKLAARACNFKFCKNPKNYCMLGGPIHPQTSGCFSQDAGSRMANQKHNNTLVRIWASMALYKLFMIQDKASSHPTSFFRSDIRPILGPRTPAILPAQRNLTCSAMNGGSKSTGSLSESWVVWYPFTTQEKQSSHQTSSDLLDCGFWWHMKVYGIPPKNIKKTLNTNEPSLPVSLNTTKR